MSPRIHRNPLGVSIYISVHHLERFSTIHSPNLPPAYLPLGMAVYPSLYLPQCSYVTAKPTSDNANQSKIDNTIDTCAQIHTHKNCNTFTANTHLVVLQTIKPHKPTLLHLNLATPPISPFPQTQPSASIHQSIPFKTGTSSFPLLSLFPLHPHHRPPWKRVKAVSRSSF